MKNLKLSVIFLMVFGLILAACQPAEAPDDYIYGEDAVVETLEVLLIETLPADATVNITGYLPDGCTKLDEITVERQEDEFILSLITRTPAGDVVCTQALVPFEESVDLDILGLEAGTYTVIAQDQETSFTLAIDNVFEEPVDLGDFELGSDAVVESLSLVVMESYPVQVRVSLVGYLPDACTEIHEITAEREDDTFFLDVVTRRPTGDVLCAMVITPFEEDIDLEVRGLPAGDYDVVYNDLSESFSLDTDN
jgi:inhibitor of cysteine peptidase